ncbi:MAG: MoxR family ATPase [Chitinophagaceae bacterium]
MPTQTVTNRDIALVQIPLNNDAISYVADEALIQAVEMAIALNKPLVVSGEPGTGKTQLAHWVAARLHEQTKNDTIPFAEKAKVFNTKSTSSASDLFYYYDAVSHFRTKEDQPTSNFIELCAMGLAIVQLHGKNSPDLKDLAALKDLKTLKDTPQSSVVLIDEIDKAPRDFPNDLLNEMEQYEFNIKELNQTVQKPNSKARIVVIMTSNSEKNLPNAFLRRCIFYHIPFPDTGKLLDITRSRMQIKDASYDTSILQAIEKFNTYRSKAINKKPATSEFLDWINILKQNGLFNGTAFGQYASDEQKQLFRSSHNALFKSKEDMDAALSSTDTPAW